MRWEEAQKQHEAENEAKNGLRLHNTKSLRKIVFYYILHQLLLHYY